MGPLAGRSTTISAPRDWVPLTVAVALACLAVLLLDVVALSRWGFREPPGHAVLLICCAAGWWVVGLTAVLLGREPMGRLMLGYALVVSIALLRVMGVQDTGLLANLAVTVSSLLVYVQTALAAHALLAFPTGVLADVGSRRLVGFTYLVTVVETAWWGLVGDLDPCGGCARNLLAVADVSAPATRVSAAALTLAWVCAAPWFLVLLARRYRLARPLQRMVLLPLFVTILASVVLFFVVLWLGVGEGASAYGVSPDVAVAVQVAGFLGIPVCFLLGVLREHLAYARIGDLVTRLSAGNPDVQAALATVLQDPGLLVIFPEGERHLAHDGRSVDPPTPTSRQAVTSVGDAENPVAFIVHDSSLSDEPRLLTAAGSAARLAIENARLRAQVHAQLQEVTESRARVVAAADQTRRRIERDLHDGAQQRLLGIGLALRLAQGQPANQHHLEAAQLELDGALRELRELASGIHPSVLTDQGLGPALATLAHRVGPAARLTVGAGLGRFPEAVESALYFGAAEVVSNAVKHATATRIRIELVHRDGSLRIRIDDNGCGGAVPSAAGLRGVADRLAAVGGTLTVETPEQGGTRVDLVVPLP